MNDDFYETQCEGKIERFKDGRLYLSIIMNDGTYLISIPMEDINLLKHRMKWCWGS